MCPTKFEFDISQIKGLTSDSRAVKDGYLFAALPGVSVDGASFIGDAIAAGAKVVLAQNGVELPAAAKVTLILDENPRRVFAHMAAKFYAKQPDYITAVTGTNGKTSIVHFTNQLWKALGLQSASLGTLGLQSINGNEVGAMTTPDPVSLHAQLSELASDGVTHLAMEASSHGLDQHRLDGVRIKAAGFTNLSRDHLDYHKSMDEYLAAKSRLFSEILERDGVAVLNADIPEYEELKKTAKGAGAKIISYGVNGDDLRIISASPTTHGQKVLLDIFGQKQEIIFPLVGDFQLMNALCAFGLAAAQDIENTDHNVRLIAALSNLQGVPGRLQNVGGHPQGANIYVDYAHTPDALEHALRALRPHTDGKLICLFGCGGDRDKGKRPMMGEIAQSLSDVVIVTDDNPRSEDPAQIRADVMTGAPKAQNIEGRGAAIRIGIENLSKGDVLVIAGKGHEQGQIFKDHTQDFDDVCEAKKALEGMEKI